MEWEACVLCSPISSLQPPSCPDSSQSPVCGPTCSWRALDSNQKTDPAPSTIPSPKSYQPWSRWYVRCEQSVCPPNPMLPVLKERRGHPPPPQPSSSRYTTLGCSPPPSRPAPHSRGIQEAGAYTRDPGMQGVSRGQFLHSATFVLSSICHWPSSSQPAHQPHISPCHSPLQAAFCPKSFWLLRTEPGMGHPAQNSPPSIPPLTLPLLPAPLITSNPQLPAHPSNSFSSIVLAPHLLHPSPLPLPSLLGPSVPRVSLHPSCC